MPWKLWVNPIENLKNSIFTGKQAPFCISPPPPPPCLWMVFNQGRIQVWANSARHPLLTAKSCKFSLFWGSISQFPSNFDTCPPPPFFFCFWVFFANPGSSPALRLLLIGGIWIQNMHVYFSYFQKRPLVPKVTCMHMSLLGAISEDKSFFQIY